MHPAAQTEEVLLASCTVRRTRRSGPGGQHRNKVETAVVISHDPTGIEAEASERRSQAENRRVALQRLRLKLAIEYRSARVEPIPSPSELWLRRTRGGKVQVAIDHHDFPTLLAEVLDRLQDHDHNLSQTAEALQVSASQLTKLFRKHPPALQKVNQWRQERGLRKLA